MQPPKVILSGGGTGGHIFPAIAIAQALEKQCPGIKIHFVGAEGRMEMKRIPEAGYTIEGLPIQGLQRKSIWKNINLPFKIWKSLHLAGQIIDRFQPNAVVGVGGYASGPVMWRAATRGIPVFIQEQNSYAGLTNRLMAKKARSIFVAYQGMESFFPKDRLILSGNPVRAEIQRCLNDRENAVRFFNLDPTKKVVLSIGGSLGALTLNETMREGIDALRQHHVQWIWQCGKGFGERIQSIPRANEGGRVLEFIREMDRAYAAADVIISRAGAISISELCLIGKPVILVPSPNVAEDHQTHNARALEKAGAALLVTDANAKSTLIQSVLTLLEQPDQCKAMSSAILSMAKPHAADEIASVILQQILPSS